MANTYVAIATVTVSTSAPTTIEFNTIPTTYTDLLVKLSVRTSKGSVSDSLGIYFNGSSTGYTTRSIVGNGSTATSGTDTGYTDAYVGESNADGATASTFSNQEIYIPNYQSSNNKSFSVDSVAENNATQGYNQTIAGIWANTAAITSVRFRTFNTTNRTFNQYTTATLYGIKNS
jgi:hypothetical protein